MSNYTLEVISVGEHRVQAYSAQGYYLHRWPDAPTTWQVRRGDTVLIKDVLWCEAKDEFWRNTGIDLGNAWGDCTPTQKQPIREWQVAEVKQERKATMCEPTYTQETYTVPVYHDTTPTADPFLSALLGGVAAAGVAGIALLATLCFGLAIFAAFVAALPVSVVIVYGWKYKMAIWHGLLALDSALWTVLTLPFLLAYRGVRTAAQAIKTRPAQTPGVLLLTGPVAITNPARLLTVQEVEKIEVAARPVPVAVKRPTKKAKVK